MGMIYVRQMRRLEICNMKINKARGLKLKSFVTHTRADARIQKHGAYALGNLLPSHLTRPAHPQDPPPFPTTGFSVDLENYSHFMALIMRSRVAHVAAALLLLLLTLINAHLMKLQTCSYIINCLHKLNKCRPNYNPPANGLPRL